MGIGPLILRVSCYFILLDQTRVHDKHIDRAQIDTIKDKCKYSKNVTLLILIDVINKHVIDVTLVILCLIFY